MSYANQHIRYERREQIVTPVRVRKEWVETRNGRRFIVTRVTETGFARPETALESTGGMVQWRSTPPPAPTTRESLKAAGLLREAGEGEPYLPCGTPSEWPASIANGPDAWEVAA